MNNRKNEKRKLTGIQIAKEWRDMQRVRLKRMKVLYKAFKKRLKSIEVSEKELDEIAVKLEKNIVPDLEQMRWMAILGLVSERESK